MNHETPVESITKLIYTYAERIDAGDFVGVAEVFAHGTPRTKHVMTNVMVDVDEEGTSAGSRSYFTVLQAVPGGLALQPVIAGRYRHTYTLAGGRWRFASMHIIIDLVGDLGHHMLGDLAP